MSEKDTATVNDMRFIISRNCVDKAFDALKNQYRVNKGNNLSEQVREVDLFSDARIFGSMGFILKTIDESTDPDDQWLGDTQLGMGDVYIVDYIGRGMPDFEEIGSYFTALAPFVDSDSFIEWGTVIDQKSDSFRWFFDGLDMKLQLPSVTWEDANEASPSFN